MFDSLLALMFDTVSLGWRQQPGWRFWYGAGASVTLLWLVVRTMPAARRFFRETQWTPPAMLMGTIVLTVGPTTALAACTLAWPLVLLRLVTAGRRGA